MNARRWRTAVAVGLTATVLAACGGGDSAGGDGESAGGDGRSGAETTLTVVAAGMTEPGWRRIVPAFTDTEDGRDVEVKTSFGPSGEQSRDVADGERGDLVTLATEADVTRLVETGKVPEGWNADATAGTPYRSVVTLVVREGNPADIRDWPDLLRPGVEVVTPSPLTSGQGEWNLLAPYAIASGGGADPQGGLDYIRALVADHVTTRAESGRDATDAFLRGAGEVLITAESEAIDLERRGEPVERVTPPQTLRMDGAAAVLIGTAHAAEAYALKNFLFTPQAQRLWAEAGVRPVDPAVADAFAADFPAPERLWTVTDLGGWDTVEPALFDEDNGSITTIYRRAIG